VRHLLPNFRGNPKKRSTTGPPTAGDLRSRRQFLLAGATLVYGAVWLVVGRMWYGRGEHTAWHWFDDRAEWHQMDKVGHAYSAFHFSRFAHALLRWVGVPEAKARQWAAGLGFGAYAPVELLDGFAHAYGASWSDLVANAAGSGLHYAQASLAPDHAWLKPKYSFWPSPFAPLRPQLLGQNLAEQVFKDYNGQTYWLSLAPSPDLAKAWQAHLPWLRVAVGYGATGMVYAREAQNLAHGHQSRRRFLVGLDIDFGFLRQKLAPAPGTEVLISLLELYRLPAPSVEL
jgi:Predicted periplasmic lipoprotein (DUF2279)